MPETSASWKASSPRSTTFACPVITTIGHRVHLRGEDAGDRVGGAGARGDEDHGGLAAGARVAVRHVGGALLVPGEHEVDGGIHQRVEQGNGGPAGQAEDVLHPLLLQHVHHGLGAGAPSSSLFSLPWYRLAV